MPDLIALVSGYLGEVEHRDYGSEWYRQSAAIGPAGSTIAWDSRGGTDEVLIEVRQTDCDALGLDDSLMLLAALLGLGMKPTRLDVYVDDYRQTVSPAAMVAAFDRGQVVTRMVNRSLHDDGRAGMKGTFGSRSSEVYYRVYEKRDDERGERVRHELEAKGRVAVELARAVLVGGPAVSTVMWAYLTGVLDFRDRAPGQAHGERAARLDWWASLVEDVDRVRVAARARVDYLAKRAKWLQHAVGRILASAWAGYGDVWLNDLLVEGMDRLRPRDLAMVRAVSS